MRRVGVTASVIAIVIAGGAVGSSAAAPLARVAVSIETKVKETAAGAVHSGTFTLVADDLDSGRVDSKVDGYRSGKRNGQPYEVIRATDTLVGRRGTLVIRTRDSVAVPAGKGYYVITGTWFVVRGTGAYAGAKGTGHSATVVLPSASFKAVSYSRSVGYLTYP